MFGQKGRFAALDPEDAEKVVPQPVREQWKLREKHNYEYRVLENGNIENNSTLYIATRVAHTYQIESLFHQAIQRAKSMPEIFGEDFDCDVVVNLVRRNTGQYVGVAYVDVSSPIFYNVLIGLHPDGSERAEYYDDPSWIPPVSGKSWADDIECPKLRKEFPPLLRLSEYEYDQEQKEHLNTDETHGTVIVSPAFINTGWHDSDSYTLFVQNVPANDINFLYAIFARYARTNIGDLNNSSNYYPKITIKETREKRLVALVKYAHWHDAGFAFAMRRKICALYQEKEIILPVRFARQAKHT